MRARGWPCRWPRNRGHHPTREGRVPVYPGKFEADGRDLMFECRVDRAHFFMQTYTFWRSVILSVLAFCLYWGCGRVEKNRPVADMGRATEPSAKRNKNQVSSNPVCFVRASTRGAMSRKYSFRAGELRIQKAGCQSERFTEAKYIFLIGALAEGAALHHLPSCEIVASESCIHVLRECCYL